MIGILTEKPSASRNFAKALGGISGTYDGEQYMIVNARGHLYELVKPEEQVSAVLSNQYRLWNLDNLPWNETDFIWKRTKKQGVASELKRIKDVLSKCDEVVIATDVDPTGEGNLLAWEILDELKIRPKKFSRMYFMDEAVPSIQKAFKTRKELVGGMLADGDYRKAFYRSKWDFLSMQFTRIATLCGDGKSVLRQGRLKSAMVRLTGDALAALKAYKKIPSYQNRFRDENGIMYSNKDEPVFPTKDQVPNIYHVSDVVVDSKEIKQQAPPKMFDLAKLSATLSSSGVTADEVLATYQKMYEAQIVSYPRTEDKFITPEQFNDLLPKVDAIAKVVGVDIALLTHRTPRNTHVKTGGAHGANRPGPNVPASLDVLRQYGACAPMIYEILAKNYLATLAENYEYESQKGHLKDYPAFMGTASVPKKLGFKAIFSDDDDIQDDTSAGLGTKAEPFIHEGFPPRPPKPTMKWLMAQLEQRDVGTGATRTSIYSEVTSKKSKYPLLVDKKGNLSMSQYGEMSYLLLKDTHIGDLQITEQLMSDMRNIADGKANPDECLHKVQQLVIDDMTTMKKNGESMRKELNINMSTNTGNVQKEKYTGTWNGKQVSFTRQWGAHRFTDEECEKLLAGEEIEIHGLIGKNNKEYGIRGKLSEQTYNGHKFVGFERLGFANSNDIPDEWCQHKFTDDEKTMLRAGKKVHIDGAVSKKGNVFECDVRYGENEKGFMSIIIAND